MRNWEAPHCDVPPNVPVLTGCQWISLDVTGSKIPKKSNRDNDLQHSMDVLGTPWKVEVERVKGIEPSLSVWETDVLPLNYTRDGRRFYVSHGLPPNGIVAPDSPCRRGMPCTGCASVS